MNPKNKMLTGLAAIVLGAGTANAQTPSYVYTDDFSTNKMEQESFVHSPVYEQTPSPVGPAYFMYLGEGIDRKLGFFRGVENPSPQVVYVLPLNEERNISGGKIEFDTSILEISTSSFFQVEVNTSRNIEDGITYFINTAKHCEFPIYAGQNLLLNIQGKGLAIDNLKVEINYDGVPDQKTTFGDIKALYR